MLSGGDTLNQLEYCGSNSGTPKKVVVITDCGELAEGTEAK